MEEVLLGETFLVITYFYLTQKSVLILFHFFCLDFDYTINLNNHSINGFFLLKKVNLQCFTANRPIYDRKVKQYLFGQIIL